LNPNVHYRIYKCPPLAPILSQLDPVHTPTSHFSKIHPFITFPSTPWSSKCSLSLRFPHHSLYNLSPSHSLYIPLQSYYSRDNCPKNLCRAVHLMKLLIMKFSPFPCYLVPLIPIYSPQHPILKHTQPTFLPQCQRPSFTPIEQNRQNYISVFS
jgi:hypothetical protein